MNIDALALAMLATMGSVLAPLPETGVNSWIHRSGTRHLYMAVDLHEYLDHPQAPGNPCEFSHALSTIQNKSCKYHSDTSPCFRILEPGEEECPKLVWNEAREYAKSLDYNGAPVFLATPQTQVEDEFIRDYVLKGTNEEFAAGGYQPDSDSENNEGWVWIEEGGGGTIPGNEDPLSTLGYENWGDPYEPNGGIRENCLMIKGPETPTDGYSWNDLPCDACCGQFMDCCQDSLKRFILLETVMDPISFLDTLGVLCDGEWKNHGHYVKAGVEELNALVINGTITSEEKGEITSAAAQSDCGKKRHLHVGA